uniref:Pre-mRNA-splicing factor 38 n=1 Tax=Parascaris equorum TaxID=6256 RepID=A0A914RDF6_PAREQ
MEAYFSWEYFLEHCYRCVAQRNFNRWIFPEIMGRELEVLVVLFSSYVSSYIRALGAMYLRLTFSSIEVYKYLEPLYNDYRKLRYMNKDGRPFDDIFCPISRLRNILVYNLGVEHCLVFISNNRRSTSHHEHRSLGCCADV